MAAHSRELEIHPEPPISVSAVARWLSDHGQLLVALELPRRRWYAREQGEPQDGADLVGGAEARVEGIPQQGEANAENEP
jgi:hypothetical protein